MLIVSGCARDQNIYLDFVRFISGLVLLVFQHSASISGRNYTTLCASRGRELLGIVEWGRCEDFHFPYFSQIRCDCVTLPYSKAFARRRPAHTNRYCISTNWSEAVNNALAVFPPPTAILPHTHIHTLWCRRRHHCCSCRCPIRAWFIPIVGFFTPSSASCFTFFAFSSSSLLSHLHRVCTLFFCFFYNFLLALWLF